VFVRVKSFEPGVIDFTRRLYDAYAAEVARVDENDDGVITFVEAEPEEESDGLSNERLFLSPTVYTRVRRDTRDQRWLACTPSRSEPARVCDERFDRAGEPGCPCIHSARCR
jgi:hypothetical protein